MTTKEIIGGAAVVIGSVGQFLYVWQIFHHKIKPHIFSWIIWGILTLIGFTVQYFANAGPGCWTMGVFALFCLLIIITGFFYGEKSITRGDWICFLALLSAIPVWMATHNPLWAIIIVSAIDAGAFYPTFRKSWLTPYDESAIAFSIYGLQLLLSLGAMETFNLTTALYPIVAMVMNAALVCTLLYRRKVLA